MQVNDVAIFPVESPGNGMAELTWKQRPSIKANLTRKGRELRIIEQLLKFVPVNVGPVLLAQFNGFFCQIGANALISTFGFEVPSHGI